ncbi:hypothetical protein A2V82_11325 [candidate division KSB1 bacterium RBG_16_48_16]|nr:MAG: hypothetical protein A2V82_11325 [candidate division KSB1 bacterium RBG_16_48_16]
MVAIYMKCEAIRENISAYFDGQLDRQHVDAMLHHVGACNSCQRIFDGFKSLQEFISAEIHPLQAPACVDDLLASRIANEKQQAVQPKRWLSVFDKIFDVLIPSSKWAVAGQLATVFIVSLSLGLFIARHINKPQNPVAIHEKGESKTASPTVSLPPETESRLEQDVNDFLENTTLVMLNLKNTDYSGDPRMLEEEQKLARKLLSESRLVSEKVTGSRSTYMKNLVDEMEPVLLEFANLDAQRDSQTVDVLRQQVQKNDYLQKVNLIRLMSQE